MLNIDIDRTYTSFCLAILTESDQMYLNQIFKKVDLSDILIAARRTKNNPVGVHRVSSQAAEILSNFIMALEVLQITYILDALFMSDHNRIIHANSLVDAITYKHSDAIKKIAISCLARILAFNCINQTTKSSIAASLWNIFDKHFSNHEIRQAIEMYICFFCGPQRSLGINSEPPSEASLNEELCYHQNDSADFLAIRFYGESYGRNWKLSLFNDHGHQVKVNDYEPADRIPIF